MQTGIYNRLTLMLSSLCFIAKTDSCMTVGIGELLDHSQTVHMLESCEKWLEPGLGLIKLANPAAGNWLPRPKNGRGH